MLLCERIGGVRLARLIPGIALRHRTRKHRVAVGDELPLRKGIGRSLGIRAIRYIRPFNRALGSALWRSARSDRIARPVWSVLRKVARVLLRYSTAHGLVLARGLLLFGRSARSVLRT